MVRRRNIPGLLNEWLKVITICITFIVSIWTGGYVFHEKVMSDLDKRIEMIPKSFSQDSGNELKERVDKLEGRIDKRFDKIDQDLTSLLRGRVSAITTTKEKMNDYGFNNP